MTSDILLQSGEFFTFPFSRQPSKSVQNCSFNTYLLIDPWTVALPENKKVRIFLSLVAPISNICLLKWKGQILNGQFLKFLHLFSNSKICFVKIQDNFIEYVWCWNWILQVRWVLPVNVSNQYVSFFNIHSEFHSVNGRYPGCWIGVFICSFIASVSLSWGFCFFWKKLGVGDY